MRLSSIANKYDHPSGILEHFTHTASEGETEFTLTFTEGNEEVYRNGVRQVRGAAFDYTTSPGKISFRTGLTEGDVIYLVGRSSHTQIPYSKAQSELITLNSGQLDVTFSTISTDPIEIYVSGIGKLMTPNDYTITTESTIRLSSSYPQGTTLEGIQANRIAATDPSSMVVNDGTRHKSLSERFRNTQESSEYFKNKNGRQLQRLAVGLVLKAWAPSGKGVIEDGTGLHPVIEMDNGSLWEPAYSFTDDFTVTGWSTSGHTLTVNTVRASDDSAVPLTFVRRVSVATGGMPSGTWDDPLVLNGLYLWATGSGEFRKGTTAPTAETDGSLV